jgi:hypothetical protein
MKTFFSALFFLMIPASLLHAQVELAKYGNDFLTAGGGARALGMGSAQVAIADDITAAYWNVAGLSSVNDLQIAYMHSERFGGIVGYDYGAVAYPLRDSNGVLALSFFRQGVDNIANTLNAFDPDRGLPVANPEDRITYFSAADMAVFLSYATQKSENLSLGATAKVVHQRLGPFATAWGYSFDFAGQLRTDFADFGIQINDITTMRKLWEVDASEFNTDNGSFQEVFNDSLPDGTNEFVLPSVRAGAAKTIDFSDFRLIAAADLNLFFENRRAYYLNMGRMSIEPQIGAEVGYKQIIFFRTGLTDFIDDPENGFTMSPTLGLGFNVSYLQLDYSFASFAGATSDLGFTHRVSVKFDLGRN